MTDETKPKLKSKWFVVATEGATTDGRKIERNWITEMAETYDPVKTYGARINLDHIKFYMYWEDVPNSHCFGDVLAVKAQERDDGKMQLLAEIKPTDGLIELNQKGQKVYTSVEIDTDFANTGKAYLVGLAVTDNPASLGTEMLAFSNNGLSGRKLKPENLFSAAVETALEFEEMPEGKTSIFTKIKELFGKKDKSDDQRFTDNENAIELLGEQVVSEQNKVTKLTTEVEELKSNYAGLSTTVDELKDKFAEVEKQPAANYTERPQVAGESQSDGRYF